MKSHTAIIIAGLIFVSVPDIVEGERGPRIVFSQDTADLGQMLSGEKTEYRFKFQNQGDKPLIIEEIKVSCGCTAVTVSQKKTPPGKEGEIKVIFDSLGFEGEVLKHIEIYTNDPENSLITLELKAQVQPTVEVSPRDLDFGVIHMSQAKPSDFEGFIMIKDLVNAGLKVKSMEADISFSQARIEQEKQNETKIKVWITPGDYRHLKFRDGS